MVLHKSALDRMFRPVEKVKERLHRATSLLEAAKIPYAVIGGNAVTAWVSRRDEGGVRNTPNVDFLIDREDFNRLTYTFQAVGFVRQDGGGIRSFLDDPRGRPREAFRVIFAGEKVRSDDLMAAPGLETSMTHESYRIIGLVALVQMKLTAYRTIDRVHLRDMLDVGLIDATWPNRYPLELGERLQALIDDPEG